MKAGPCYHRQPPRPNCLSLFNCYLFGVGSHRSWIMWLRPKSFTLLLLIILFLSPPAEASALGLDLIDSCFRFKSFEISLLGVPNVKAPRLGSEAWCLIPGVGEHLEERLAVVSLVDKLDFAEEHPLRGASQTPP
jgi:hypothetical protein